jgi:hypothetical protein
LKEDKQNEERKPRSRTVTHTVRSSDGGLISLRLTRKSAIAAQCTECMGFASPRDCTARLCPLWAFRAKTLATRWGDRPQATYAAPSGDKTGQAPSAGINQDDLDNDRDVTNRRNQNADTDRQQHGATGGEN